jgi:hypothetical protein
MPRILRNLRIDEVSMVDKGAGENCRVLLMKRHTPKVLMFADILLRDQPLRDDDIQRTNTEPDDKKLSAKLKEIVAAMIAAAPSLHPQHAMRWLMHSEQGRALLAQHTTKGQTMPQVDIAKIIPVLEDALNAQVIRRDGESFAKSFSRKYETDIDFRRQWASVSEANNCSVWLLPRRIRTSPV